MGLRQFDVKLNQLKIVDLTDTLKNSDSKIIVNTIRNNNKVLGIKLNNFPQITSQHATVA